MAIRDPTCCCFPSVPRVPLAVCLAAWAIPLGVSVRALAAFLEVKSCFPLFGMLSYVNYTQNHLFGGMLPCGSDPHACSHAYWYTLLIWYIGLVLVFEDHIVTLSWDAGCGLASQQVRSRLAFC